MYLQYYILSFQKHFEVRNNIVSTLMMQNILKFKNELLIIQVHRGSPILKWYFWVHICHVTVCCVKYSNGGMTFWGSSRPIRGLVTICFVILGIWWLCSFGSEAVGSVSSPHASSSVVTPCRLISVPFQTLPDPHFQENHPTAGTRPFHWTLIEKVLSLQPLQRQ